MYSFNKVFIFSFPCLSTSLSYFFQLSALIPQCPSCPPLLLTTWVMSWKNDGHWMMPHPPCWICSMMGLTDTLWAYQHGNKEGNSDVPLCLGSGYQNVLPATWNSDPTSWSQFSPTYPYIPVCKQVFHPTCIYWVPLLVLHIAKSLWMWLQANKTYLSPILLMLTIRKAIFKSSLISWHAHFSDGQ